MNRSIVNNGDTLQYMTYYRGFAIIMIVMVHSVTNFFDKQNVLYPYVYQFFLHSTNIFLFISGFLFEYLQFKKYPYRIFIKKKFKRLIVPYLFWALPIALILMLTKYKVRGGYLAWTMWTGVDHYNNAHWYITFIILVFLIVPLLRKAIPSGKVMFGVVMPLFLFLTLISGRAKIGWFYNCLNFFPLIGMFFLGMFFARYKAVLVHRLFKFDWLFILLGLLVCFFTAYAKLEREAAFEDAICNLFHGVIKINWAGLNKFFFAIGFLLFFYRINLCGYKLLLLSKLANYSFAIYFVHLYVVKGLWVLIGKIGLYENRGILFFLVASTFVLSISAAIVWVLRQIKWTKNIVGV